MFSSATQAWADSGRFINAGGHRLFAVERGRGPVLVLVHGFPTSSYDYRALMAQLDARFRCIAYDFPGYGLSDKPAAYSYSLFQQADALEAALVASGVMQARFVAHDMGTSVLTELLARQDEARLPFQIEHVTFTNGSVLQWRAEITPFQKLLATNESLPSAMELCARIPEIDFIGGLRSLTRRPEAITADDAIVMRELMLHADGHLRLPAQSLYMRERYLHRDRWLPALARDPARVSFAWATEDPIANLALGRELHALVPEARYAELDGVGHFVIFEDPERVAAAVLAAASCT